MQSLQCLREVVTMIINKDYGVDGCCKYWQGSERKLVSSTSQSKSQGVVWMSESLYDSIERNPPLCHPERKLDWKPGLLSYCKSSWIVEKTYFKAPVNLLFKTRSLNGERVGSWNLDLGHLGDSLLLVEDSFLAERSHRCLIWGRYFKICVLPQNLPSSCGI